LEKTVNVPTDPEELGRWINDQMGRKTFIGRVFIKLMILDRRGHFHRGATPQEAALRRRLEKEQGGWILIQYRERILRHAGA
jgi:hypothetical protein